MSLSADRLGGLLEGALLAAGASSATPKTAALGDALAAAVIDELVDHAVIPGPTFSAPPSGGTLTGASTITSLDATRLKAPIKAALIAAGAADIPKTDTFAQDLATAIVNEIQTNAVVPPGSLVATNTPASPGTVTGSSTITGLVVVRLSAPLNAALETSGAAPGVATGALALALATAILGEILSFASVIPVAGIVASAGGPLIGTLEVN